MKTVGHWLQRRITGLAGIGLVLLVWWAWSPAIVWVMDQNLWIIGMICDQLGTYGPRAESVLRLALHADKALLWMEGIWIARITYGLISGQLKGMTRSNHRMSNARRQIA